MYNEYKYESSSCLLLPHKAKGQLANIHTEGKTVYMKNRFSTPKYTLSLVATVPHALLTTS